MDSRLDPVFRTIMRHAETLDTRQAIHRHEQTDDKGKKRGRADTDDDPDVWEDSISVSVPALKEFLKRLAHESGPVLSADKKNVAIAPEKEDVQESVRGKEETPSARTAQALQAYKRTELAMHASQGHPSPPEDALSFPVLKPEEIRIVHRLIDDLDRLEKDGVRFLTIEKSESFLSGLVTAVDRLKA